MTNEEIIQRGILIRDETEPAQNTSERVGSGIEGIGRNLADKDAAIAAEAARNGYYQCTVSGTTLAVTAPGFTLPAHGGNIRIKMSAPATGASTLNINGTGAKTLLYNGAAVSSANTWEKDEIISVFYDPSGSGQYLASNSQGGGGKAEKIKYDNSQSGLVATNVQKALDEIEETVSDMDDTIIGGVEDINYSSWPNGAYLNESGGIGSGSTFKHTSKPILVKAGQTLSAKSGGYGYWVFLKTNADMSSIEGITRVNSASSTPYTYTPNEDTYVLVSVMTSGSEIKLNKGQGVIGRIESLENIAASTATHESRITSLETEVYGAKSTVEYTNQAQGFIKSNGYANTTTSNYSYTNLIDVSSYGKIEITSFFASSSTLAIAAYKDGTESIDIASQAAIVSKSVVGNGTAARSYKIPSGIKYIRLSYDRTRTAAPVITGYAKTTVNELVQQTTELDERVDVLEKNEITTVVPIVAELPGMCYYNGGLVSTVSGAMCRKYDVEGIETLLVTTRFNAGSSGFYLAIFVDSNDTVIEQQYVIPAGSTAVVTDEPFSVPSGAKYVYINSRGNTSLPKVKTYDKIDARIKAQSGGKYISILFVGNSLTQDAVSYVPLLLKELAPSLNFKLYIFYNGGKTLAQQYTIITNDTACEIYSECVNKTSWTNYERTKRMSEIINSIQFDVLCLQEYYNYGTQDISAYNNIVDWFMTNYAYPFKLITLFHAPLRWPKGGSSSQTYYDEVFARTLAGIKNILKTTPTVGLIPAGIAIYRALYTSLVSLGDDGYLTPDGTHAQEGLPCMLEAYVTALWILQEMAIPAGVLRANTIVTRGNYLPINVPGPNYGSGCVVGTAEQVRLSQVVATKAWKEGLSILSANQTEYTD